MNYTSSGAVAVGYGCIRVNDVDFGDHPYDNKQPEPKTDHFRIPATGWRVSKIGELIEQDIYSNRSGVMGRVAEHELAFFVLNNVRGVKMDTPCLIGAAARRKCLRVNGVEYRQLNGKLFERVL